MAPGKGEIACVAEDGTNRKLKYSYEDELGGKCTFRVYHPLHPSREEYVFLTLEPCTETPFLESWQPCLCVETVRNGFTEKRWGVTDSLFPEVARVLRTNIVSLSSKRTENAENMWTRFVAKGFAEHDPASRSYVCKIPSSLSKREPRVPQARKRPPFRKLSRSTRKPSGRSGGSGPGGQRKPRRRRRRTGRRSTKR